jgi:leader peptidase (prepilin peptidase)/N-methyltransferase
MLAACVFSWLALALAFFDAESYWLPDLLTLPGIALGFFFRCAGDLALLPERAEVAALHAAFTLLEIVAAALLILLIRWLYFLVRHHEGMGLGDAKLMAMLAAWLGWQRMLLAFVLGIFLAATFAAAQLLPGISKQRVHDGKLDWARKMLPFGTFLCCGGLMSFFFGGRLIALYLALSGF